MIRDYSAEILGESHKALFVKIRLGAGYRKFRFIVEAVPAGFDEAVAQVKIPSAQANGVVAAAFVGSFKFSDYLSIGIEFREKLQGAAADTL